MNEEERYAAIFTLLNIYLPVVCSDARKFSRSTGILLANAQDAERKIRRPNTLN